MGRQQAAPEGDPGFATVAEFALSSGTIYTDAGLMRTRWVVSGSRLLQNHRAAFLESGSPPSPGQLVRGLGLPN